MAQTLRVLLIDDNSDDRLLVRRELERVFSELQVQEISKAESFQQALEAGSFDVVVTDYQLRWSNGIQLLEAIKARYPHCPVVMFTSTGSEEIAVQAMKAGLDDYLIKAPRHYIRVPLSIRSALERVEAQRKTQRLETQLAHLLAQEQAARLEAETANRLKDEFLATLSHELRTPLNAMLGWARLLRLRRLSEGDYDRAVETIERNISSLVQLIEDLLDVSRIITGKLSLTMRPLNLSPLLEAALAIVRPAADAKGIDLNCEIEANVGTVAGDTTRIQQIFWNLLSNAVKFTPDGGQVQVRLTQAESRAVLTIQDTGQGISADFLPHIFERFRQADGSITRSHGGLGLGLSIVRHLVELHGGTVEAASAGVGEGAIFTVKLPLLAVRTQRQRSEAATVLSEATQEKTIDRVRILVVDDEPDTRELIKLVLEQYGADVKTANSSGDAWTLFQRFMPDILVCDIGLPGEDGYSLMQKIRTLPAHAGGYIPAIALTAYAGEENRNRALAAGFSIHIAKPVDPSDLTNAIIRFV